MLKFFWLKGEGRKKKSRQLLPRVGALVRSISCNPQPSISKTHGRAANTATRELFQKVSRGRGEIALVASRNRRNGEQDFQTRGIKRGAIMTITEYLAATILVALISWAVLGLLMQES